MLTLISRPNILHASQRPLTEEKNHPSTSHTLLQQKHSVAPF